MTTQRHTGYARSALSSKWQSLKIIRKMGSIPGRSWNLLLRFEEAWLPKKLKNGFEGAFGGWCAKVDGQKS